MQPAIDFGTAPDRLSAHLRRFLVAPKVTPLRSPQRHPLSIDNLYCHSSASFSQHGASKSQAPSRSGGGSVMNLAQKLEQYTSEEQTIRWQGPFGEYFDGVLENPALARLSHARVYEMIMS